MKGPGPAAPRFRLRSQQHPWGDSGLSGGYFLAVLEATAQHLDEAALAMDHDACGARIDHFAEARALDLGEGPSDVLARVEQIEAAAIDRRPGAGRRVAAANEVVSDLDMVGPVDARFRRAHPALVCGLALVLMALLRLAGDDEVGRLEQSGHAQREDPVEIEAAHGVVRPDRNFLLQQDGPFVEPFHRPEDAEARAAAPEHDRPIDRGWSAMEWQQRGVELDRAVPRHPGEGLWDEGGDVGHDADIRLEPAQRLDRLGRAVTLDRDDRHALFLGGGAQRVRAAPWLVRRDEDAGDRIAAREKGIQHRLAESLLADDSDAHSRFPLRPPGGTGSRPCARRQRPRRRSRAPPPPAGSGRASD